MSTSRLLVRSGILRVSGTVINMVIAFFMMPFMIQVLGDTWYGIWTIIGSLIGAYYLLDFGFASAVSRYVAEFITKQSVRQVNTVLSTALCIYCGLAGLILLLAGLLCAFADSFVDNPAHLETVQWLIWISGLTLALEFPFKAFTGIANAHLRYDLTMLSRISTSLLGAGLTYWWLSQGGGVLAVAYVGLLVSVISNGLFFLIARYLFPKMSLSVALVERFWLKKLWNYSCWSFLITLSEMLRNRIDSFIIAAVLSSSVVTHYFIGFRLVDYATRLLFQATSTVTPLFTRYYVNQDFTAIQQKLALLSKLNAALAAYMVAALLVFGEPLLLLWMGEAYLDAYPVMVALALAHGLTFPVHTLVNVLYASSNHKVVALCDLVEGGVNVLLSLLLIFWWDMLGVALATAISLILLRLCVLPYFACRLIKLRVRDYYHTFVPILLTTIPSYFVLTAVLQWFQPVSYLTILLGGGISAFGYGVLIFFFFFNVDERRLLLGGLPPHLTEVIGKVSAWRLLKGKL